MLNLHKTLFAVLFTLLLPAAAHAGFVLEGSLGRGMQVAPDFEPTLGRTNLLIAPGYGFGQLLRAELGFVMDIPQGKYDLNLRVRPMLVIDPPLLPIYGRVIIGFANLVDDPVIEFGGAVGVGMELGGVGIFAELGILPQDVPAPGSFIWLLEGRAGAFISFD